MTGLPLDDWDRFALAALSARLAAGAPLAAVLLAAGAMLGAPGLRALVATHRARVDAEGEDWGAEAIGELATAELDAAEGGVLLRTLGRHADPAAVDALQADLRAAQQGYATLGVDAAAGDLDPEAHRAAAAALFAQLASEEG